MSSGKSAGEMRGQLVSRDCATGWFERSRGELWLLPDGLLLVRGSLLEKFADQQGSRLIPRDAVVVRNFGPDEPESLAGQDKKNLWLRADEIRSADLREGLTADRLRLSLGGGRTAKLLIRQRVHASPLLRAAFGRWGLRPDWLSGASEQVPLREVSIDSLPRAQLPLRRLLLVPAAAVGLVAIGIAARHTVDWLFPPGPVGPRIVAAAKAPRPQILIRHPGLYFIAHGPVSRAQLKGLARHFGTRLHLRTTLLAPIRPSISAVNDRRHQLISENAINEVSAHVRADRPLHALVLAITPYDAYPSTNPSWHFTFGIRGRSGSFGAGLISTARMAIGADAATRRHRLRVMVARYIGEAYFGLPRNGDPRSALYKSIRRTSDLDAMTEYFCPAQPAAIRGC